MTGRRTMEPGFGTIELLVGTALGMLVFSALTAAIASGGRLLMGSGRRAEAEDTAQLALEALLFDLRRAGYDPRALGASALTEAGVENLTVEADLDGDGTIDGASEERVRYLYNPAARRVSRIVGRQSMPVADGVLGWRFAYRDAQGNGMLVPPTGLAVSDLPRVRSVMVDLALRPAGATGVAARTTAIALRRAE